MAARALALLAAVLAVRGELTVRPAKRGEVDEDDYGGDVDDYGGED